MKQIIIFLLIFTSCRRSDSPTDEYSSIIDNILRFNLNHVELVILETGTTGIDSTDNKDNEFRFRYNPGLLKRIFEIKKIDFEEYDFMKGNIDTSFHCLDSNQLDLQFIHQDELSGIFQNYKNIDSAYSYIHEKYNTFEYAIVSKPIFNKNKTILLLYIDTYCGSLCGEGHVFLLIKKKNKWRIMSEGQMWKS